MKQSFWINKDFINTRLDRWFRINICDIPQSLIEKNIRKGYIKVNNKKKRSSYRLQKNDQVILYKINFKPNKNKKKLYSYKPTKNELSSSEQIIIENNDNFAIINKPAGIAVQSGTKSRRNILDILRYTKEFSGTKPYPVHRLDKETTGILIVAKNRQYAQLFTSLFRIRKINKTYLTITTGVPIKDKGTFDDILYQYEGDKKIKIKAITRFSTLDSNNNYSLLKLNPVTGRKHQLRKQLLIHGHPVLGDTKYRISDKLYSSKDSLMLHAYKINFSIDRTKYNFTAELPFEFKKTLKEKYLKIY